MIEVDSRGPRIQMATSLRSAVVYLAQFLVKSCWYSCSQASRSVAWKSPKEWQELLQHSPHSCWAHRGMSQKLWDLICLVAGQYGDVSQDFHHLLKSLATSKATHTQRAILFVTQSEVYSSTNSRLHHMAPDAKEAAKRGAGAKQREALAQADRRAHFEAHVIH